MSDDGKCYAATPAATLEEHIVNSNVAKSDTEWWAHHEITRLRAELAAVTAERDRMREALKDALVWLGDSHGGRPVMSVDSIRNIANSSAAIEGVTEPPR